MVDRLTKPIRAVVLKFAIRLTIDAVMARIEGDSPGGLVRVTAADPKTWRPGQATVPVAPADRPMRVLLLVHGTFSNTSGSFGHLCAHPAGQFFLNAALDAYDAVLGFDHKTLAQSVEANAELMADALAGLPPGAQVDAIAYSRGGLVLRVLFDEIFAASRPDLRLGRAVFVGCTNAGTHLSSPANWEALADLYTNAIMAGARAVTLLAGAPLDPLVRLGVKTLGEFVQMLPQVAINERRVPGLASMQPDGETVRRLGAIPFRGDAAPAYHAITSNFVPHFELRRGLSKELAQVLLDRVTNDLWGGQPNDLVVDTESMTNFGERSGWLTDTYPFGDVETIYHTVYFTAPETSERLLAWLGLPPLPAELVVPRRTRGPVESPSAFETSPPPAMSAPSTPRLARSTRRAVSANLADVTGSSRRTTRGRDLRAMAASAAISGDSGAAELELTKAESPPPATVPPCHVTASMPETPALERPTMLEVTLSREEIAAVEGQVRAEALIPVAKAARLLVRVAARVNCRIVGDDATWVDAPKPGAPEVLGFQVQGVAPGMAEVWADVFLDNRRLTRVVLQPVFVSTGAIAASATMTPQDLDPPIVDLRILEEGGDNGLWRLRFLVSAPELGIEDEYETDWQRIDKTSYIRDLYKRLENSWTDSSGDFEPLMMLIRAEGAELFRLLPRDLQRLIWNRRDQIGSLQVFAQEPSIPWEVAWILDPDSRSMPLAGGKFLAELGLTRWITNVGVAPARLRLREDRALYCIPDYLDPNLSLPSQPDEVAMVSEVLGARPVAPHIEPVLSALGRTSGQDFDILHFACHGSADPDRIWNSGLLLEGFQRGGRVAREELSLAAVRSYANLASDGVKPIIFLNACQTGVGGYGLSGAGGLAQAFVRQGAGLFVGTLWSVADHTALVFSRTFYEQLKAGKAVVHATRAAREAAKAHGESTWLAYSVYGHPYARVQT
ncbi:hypothetical protein AS593_04200 [Caulobacter vibrioides]|nr:hypothetical protein AS593_04200 [Caulobacter vibrioides]